MSAKRRVDANALSNGDVSYPETWTDYMTVRELREALANPLLMDGDLTNVRLIRRSVDGVFSLRVVTEFDTDE